MAFPAPVVVFPDESVDIHGGKRVDAPRAKRLKPLEKKPGRFKSGRPFVCVQPCSRSTLNERSALGKHDGIKNSLTNVPRRKWRRCSLLGCGWLVKGGI
ncbi:unnamed protein product [Urochloa humidicola]